MQDSEKKQKHHHGNLREALIQAGIDLVESGGLAALSLRKCAAHAGVSHAAPAHHFNGLDGLKIAIAQEAFLRFSNAMLDAVETGPDTARGRLKSICRGYLSFGLAHPGLLQLIFGISRVEMVKAEKDGPDKGRDAYQILRDACAPFVPPGHPPEVIEVQVWSLIHGYTMLFLSGQFGPADDEVLAHQFLDLLLGLLDSLQAPAHP